MADTGPRVFDKVMIYGDLLPILNIRDGNVVTNDDAGFRIERSIARLVWDERGYWTDEIVPVSYLRCSECGDLLDGFGACEVHGVLDLNREGDPAFNGAFDKW